MTSTITQSRTPHTRPLQRLLLAAIAATAMLCIGSAQAQSAAIQVTNEVFQEVEVQAADGSTFLRTVPAVTIVPGDEVIYVIRYANTGDQPAENVAINNPLPTQLEYVSAIAPPPLLVSVDSGAQYGDLASLTVAGADGATRPAQAADVTHLRWVLDTLPPGAEGEITFVARVK